MNILTNKSNGFYLKNPCNSIKIMSGTTMISTPPKNVLTHPQEIPSVFEEKWMKQNNK